MIAIIVGLWCIYLSYDSTPFGEFEIVATATGWSFIAAATALLVMTPFNYLDKYLNATAAPERPPLAVLAARIIGRCTLIFSVLAMLSLLAFALIRFVRPDGSLLRIPGKVQE